MERAYRSGGSHAHCTKGQSGKGAYSASSKTQAAMSCDRITLLGRQGLTVPAKTIRPLRSLARANSLASASVSKVVVRRGCLGLGKTPRLCTSTVTYQLGDIVCPCAHRTLSKVHRRRCRLATNRGRLFMFSRISGSGKI